MRGGRESWFPRQDQIIDLDQETGLETFHLLAVDNVAASAQIRKTLDRLPSPPSTCAAAKGIELRALQSAELFELLKARNQGVDWQTRSIAHR